MRVHSPHPGRRTVVAVAAFAAAALALSACGSSPSVAVYLGDGVITTAELDAAVQEGLSVEPIAQLYDGDVAAYRQVVLQELIATEVFDTAAARYDVEVSGVEIGQRLDEVLAQFGDDADAFFAQQAVEGRTEAAVREQIRRFILGEEIAEAAELDTATSEAALRELYDASAGELAQYQVGLITVADQATADTALAQLTADPTAYADIAAGYPNANTLPQPETATIDQLAGLVADPTTLAAGEGFSEALLPTGEITVVFILDISTPSFEDIRPTLEQQAAQEVQVALDAELASVRESLDITVNPRYGTFDETGALVPDDRGVVTVVDDGAAADETPLN